MTELGGMRMDEVLIAVESYRYRLRIAVCLLEEHNKTILTSQATGYTEALCRDMLEAAEDATSTLRHAQVRAAEEAGLGSEAVRGDSDEQHR